EQLGLVVGGRVTKDKKTGAFETGGTFVGDRYGEGEIVGSRIFPFSFKKTKPTYSVGINYKPNSDTLLYAKHGTAFLSGGAVADLGFPPETATSYEIGLKTDLFDRMVRFNVAAYTVKYENAQATTSGTAINRPELNIAVITSGALKAKGIELDLNVAPFPGFSFGGTLGYTDAKYRDPSPLLDQGRGIVVSGVPKWAGSGNVMYVTPPLFGDATMLFRLDATYQSKTRVIEDPQIKTRLPIFGPYEFINSKTFVNARVGEVRGEGRTVTYCCSSIAQPYHMLRLSGMVSRHAAEAV
ncbi:MAG: TonB-dependent receptor, partial [Verrucomicrobiaceae bacterium]